MSPTPSWRSTRTAISSASAPRSSPPSAPICRSACRPSPAISARSPASIARRPRISTSPRCSPTPSRCGPIAATAGRKPATSSSAWSISPPTRSASIRPSCAGATPFRRAPCRSRPASPSPTIAASSKRTWTWRSTPPTRQASRRAARKARKNGKLRGFGFSNTIERSAAAGLEGAEIRFDRTGSVSIFSGSINQGQGHETAFKQVVCDRLGLDPQRSHLYPGRHRPGVLRRRHRRLALGGVFGLGLHARRGEDRDQGQGHRRQHAQGRRRRRSISPTACSRARRPTRR